MTTDDNEIPTYSLLEKHEDMVVYRIPDPTEETPAWIRIGLFPWELEGVSLGKAFLAAMIDEDVDLEYEEAEGVGLRVGFNGPTSRHPRPNGFKKRVTELFEVHSHGHTEDGATFRVSEATAGELRQMGRSVALYGFAYWWWLENRTSYEIGKKGTMAERTPEPETVLEDGVLIDRSGERHQTPYDLSQMELHSPDEWQSPYERAKADIEEVVNGLSGDVPQFTLAKALRDVEDGVVDPIEKTEAKQNRDSIRDALSGADGIGYRLRNSICREFESVEELCDDIRAGGEKTRSVRGIGESKEEAVIDALVENGKWVADQNSK